MGALYIKGIRLTNFLRYRGETVIELEPIAYAIVAEFEGEPDRSNWAGKSSLLWAILFALTGKHPRRTEDEWITDGEADGGVDLELSDGTFISRTRIRGASTQLRLIWQDGDTEREARADEAQGLIGKLIGFSLEDSLATWWQKQGKASHLCTLDPGPLTATIMEWLGIAKVDDAAALVSKAAKALALEASKLEAVIGEKRARCDALAASAELKDFDALVAAVREIETEIAALGNEAEVRAAWERHEVDRRDWQAFGRMNAETFAVADVTAPSEEWQANALREMNDAYAVAQACAAEVRQKRVLARGRFDGKCPVAGIECPAASAINAATDANSKLLAKAEENAREAEAAHDLARRTYNVIVGERRAAQDAKAREEAREAEMARVKPGRDRFLADDEKTFTDPARFVELRSDLAVARSRVAESERRAKELEALEEQIRESTVKLAGLSQQEQANREAFQLFALARRRIGETELGKVEARTNATLVECGIDLQVAFSWARETGVPARACYTCGAAFPESRKVKACQECGAERGKQLEEKPAILLTDESGGALDLAGTFLRLAATAWLRERRGLAWGVVCLDEPLGALDRYNRAAVASKLAGALRTQFGASQAFVVAHDAATLAAMPGRIRIIAGPNGSRAVVE